MRAVELAQPEERRAHVARRRERAERHDQRDQHAGADRDDRRRVLRAQAEEGQPLPADLVPDAIADVRDRTGHHDDDDDDEEPAIKPPMPVAKATVRSS